MTRVVHGVAQQGAEELAEFGLTPAQFQLLVAIRSHPGTAQKRLAEVFGVTRGNISQLVAKVEQAGLLRRNRNQGTDELELTEQGARLLDIVAPAHDAFMERTFSALSDAEQRTLLELITKLSRD